MLEAKQLVRRFVGTLMKAKVFISVLDDYT